MHVELIDRLRCPAAHDDVWLVAHAARSEERRILEGTLGCPICHREYRISDGEVWFGDDEPAMIAVDATPEPALAMRTAALLGLDERGGLYLLEGMSSLALLAMEEFPGVRWMLLSPPIGLVAEGTIRGAGTQLPVARGSVRGVVLTRPSAALARSAVTALATGGRLVAPAALPIPDGIEELARDQEQWVGAKMAGVDPATLITPRRAPPHTGSR